MRSEYDVAIVGAGFAGTTVAAELSASAPPGYRAVVFGREPPGRGSAYAPASDRLFMNGTAHAMSAVASDKQDLVRWLRTQGENALIPRLLFGRYLAERFAHVLDTRPDFAWEARAIVDLIPEGEGFAAVDERGDLHVARDVVLALGNFPPDASFLPQPLRAHANYVADPWRFDPDFRRLGFGPDAAILIVGSGLTAMDAIALLDERGFQGRMHLVSRHGLLPYPENPFARALDPAALDLSTRTPLALLRSLRRAVKRHARDGGDWREVVESIRSISPGVWESWEPAERRRFLRHLQPFWTIHRYRVPPQTAAVYERLAAAGRVVRHRGSVLSARAAGDEDLLVEVGGARPQTIRITAAINCTGPAGDYERLSDPLVRNLRERGLLRSDRLHLGLDATADLRVVNRRGRPQAHLFALGPPLRGLWYETTAVPETRDQASRIARMLVAQLETRRLEVAS